MRSSRKTIRIDMSDCDVLICCAVLSKCATVHPNAVMSSKLYYDISKTVPHDFVLSPPSFNKLLHKLELSGSVRRVAIQYGKFDFPVEYVSLTRYGVHEADTVGRILAMLPANSMFTVKVAKL